MQKSLRLLFATIGTALVSGLALPASAMAQERHDHGMPRHSGIIATTKAYQFEVIFTKDGVKVFPRTHEDKPLNTSKLSGTATFYHPNSPKPWFNRPLHVAPLVAGQDSLFLELAIGLGTVPPIGAKVAFEIAGLPESVEFTVPFEFAKVPGEASAIPPASPDGVVVTSPRDVYARGYLGVGYDQYPGPESPPAGSRNPSGISYGSPSGRNSYGISGRARDWSTGRDFQSGGLLSKPWLR
jgi:hypothetical protein